MDKNDQAVLLELKKCKVQCGGASMRQRECWLVFLFDYYHYKQTGMQNWHIDTSNEGIKHLSKRQIYQKETTLKLEKSKVYVRFAILIRRDYSKSLEMSSKFVGRNLKEL